MGACGNAEFCATTKTGAELAGTITDFKCGTCDGDKCNTEATTTADPPASDPPASDPPASDPPADSKKSFYMEETTGENGPMRSSMMTTENDCTAQKFIDLGVEGVKEGSCPAKYTTKCALKYTEKDEDGNDEVTDHPSDMDKSMSDVIGCGKITMSGMTLDCDGCQKQKELAPTGATFQKDPVCDPAPGTDGSTDNSRNKKSWPLQELHFKKIQFATPPPVPTVPPTTPETKRVGPYRSYISKRSSLRPRPRYRRFHRQLRKCTCIWISSFGRISFLLNGWVLNKLM